MQPVRCTSRACKNHKQAMYLPFKNKRLLKDADPTCQICHSDYIPLSIIHLLYLDEDGPVHGSIETTPGNFAPHPIKRWNFHCECARDNYKENNTDNPNYPHFFTAAPVAATCYECLEDFCKTLENPDRDQEKLMEYFNSKE